MKTHRVLIEDAPNFAEVLKEQLSKNTQVYSLHFGAEDSQTGKSWCPDCVIGDPVARRLVAALKPEAVLIECSVGQPQQWRDKQNPYRVNQKVTNVPTLIKWRQNGAEIGRLVEGEISNDEKWRKLSSAL